MPELPLLLAIQQDLIVTLVEAAEHVAPERQIRLLAVSQESQHPDRVMLCHPGFGMQGAMVFIGDLEVLAYRGLILLAAAGTIEGLYHITLLPEAYAYYGEIKHPSSPNVRAAVRGVTASALERATRARYVLEHAAAIYGSAAIPAHISIELEDKRAEIARLQQRLAALDAAGDQETPPAA